MLCGGFGSGKTRGFIARAINELLAPANRGQIGLLAEPTFPMIRDVLMGDLVQTLNDFGIRYTLHKSEYRITTAYGQILLRSAENWERWRGLNLAWGGIDEVAQLKTAGAWDMLLSRIRADGTRAAFASSTPEGFNFVYDLWGPGADDDYELIKAKTTDNPYLPDDYIESLLNNYSERMVDQYVNGEFVVMEGRVYEEYTKANEDDWQYHPGLPVSVAMDFGANRPSILLIQKDLAGNDHIFHEITVRNKSTHIQADKIREYLDKLGVVGDIVVYCDPAGANRQSAAHITDIAILAEHGFLPKYTTARALRAINAGVELVQGRFCNGAGKRSLFVNPKACPNLHRSLQGYRYTVGARSIPDKDGVNDHDADALRYYVINNYAPTLARGRNIG